MTDTDRPKREAAINKMCVTAERAFASEFFSREALDAILAAVREDLAHPEDPEDALEIAALAARIHRAEDDIEAIRIDARVAREDATLIDSGLAEDLPALKGRIEAMDSRIEELESDLLDREPYNARVVQRVEDLESRLCALEQANPKEDTPCSTQEISSLPTCSALPPASTSPSGPVPGAITQDATGGVSGAAPIPEPGYVLLPRGDGHVVEEGERVHYDPPVTLSWLPSWNVGLSAIADAWYECPEPSVAEHCSCHGGGDKSAVNRIDGIDYCGYCHRPLADPPAPEPQDDYGQVLLDDGVTKIPGMRVCGCGAEVPDGELRTMHCRHDAPPTPAPELQEERFGGLTILQYRDMYRNHARALLMADAYQRNRAALAEEREEHAKTRALLFAETDSRYESDAEIIAATKAEIEQVREAAESALATERQRREKAEAEAARRTREVEATYRVQMELTKERDTLKAEVAHAVRWAPSCNHHAQELKRLLGDEAYAGIDALERDRSRLAVALEKSQATATDLFSECVQHKADLAQSRARVAELEPLVFAVSMKYPGETRTETALRYIREREALLHHGGDPVSTKKEG